MHQSHLHPKHVRSPSTRYVIQRALTYLAKHGHNRISLEALARYAGMTPAHFQRTFTRVVGMSPKVYGDSVRMGLLKVEANGNFGVEKSSINYVITDTRLGRLLVAATVRGVCAVSLGNDDATVENELVAEYGSATLNRMVEGSDDFSLRSSSIKTPEIVITATTTSPQAQLHSYARTLVRYIHGDETQLTIPLDVPATPFVQQVWQLLQTIPYGETRTYTDIAAELGNINAVRAVARACASNPVALVVPCHRVLRKDGSLGGYRWGIERKQQLLDLEAKERNR
jgi:AraC family transcriptional regulator of adaptative response/methylated-DNA-[protein]-cysteine methyltransferase